MTPQETEKIKLMQLFKQGKIEDLPNVDSAYMIKKMMDKEKNMEEADLGVLNRIDGLVDQQLLIKFLDLFTEIYDDLVVGGDPFEPEEVIEYLTRRMDDRATDSNMGADGFRSFEEEVEEEVVNEEESVDEAMMPHPSLFRGTDVEKQEYYASLKRDYDRDKEEFKRNYMNFTDEDWQEDFENYVADRQLDEGVEWFKKIAGVGK